MALPKMTVFSPDDQLRIFLLDAVPESFRRISDLTFIGEAIYSCSTDSFIFFNRTMQELLEQSEEELLNTNIETDSPWASFFPPLLPLIKTDGVSEIFGVEYYSKNNRPVWLKMRCFLITGHINIYILVHAVDVTVEKYLQMQKQQAILNVQSEKHRNEISQLDRVLIEKLLTPMEIKICNLLHEDCSTKDISSKLNISEQTVSTHRHNVRVKVGLIGRFENLSQYLKKISNINNILPQLHDNYTITTR